MLTTILGNLGSGKTLLMVILAYYADKPIVANFNIQFDDKEVEEFNLNRFLQADYENCVILLDEAYTYLESRISGSELNRIMSYILFQSRKKNVELYITAQLLSSLDKRYRELSDLFIIANPNEANFRYFMVFDNKEFQFALNKQKVTPFFSCYNTNEVIFTKNEKLLFDTKDSDDKLDEIEKHAKTIEDYYHKKKINTITKDMVDLYIRTDKTIPEFLSKNIYTVIRLNAKEKKEKKKIKK